MSKYVGTETGASSPLLQLFKEKLNQPDFIGSDLGIRYLKQLCTEPSCNAWIIMPPPRRRGRGH